MTLKRAHFPASRQAAWAHWESFLPRVPDYAARRNYVIEGHSNVSRLSPAIRCRLITEEEILGSLRERFPFSTVEKFVQELLWRGYWKAWLETHPGVWADYKRQVGSARSLHPEQARRIQALQKADSGVAVIDLFTRELLETGYLHNHARMWWASYWIHVEKLPWALGADFFYRHLLDGDTASNTLSWRWVAGLQTRGKAYLVKRSNIEKYLAPTLLEERGLERLENDRFNRVETLQDDPYPFVLSPTPDMTEHLGKKRWGLWLHDEDLSPGSSKLVDSAPASIRAFKKPRGDDSIVKESPLRETYIEACLRDGISQAVDHWNLGRDQFAWVDASSLADGLVEWANQDKLETIALFRPAVGILRDQLPEVQVALRRRGIELTTFIRSWDESLYPHAKGGFFNFWEKTKASLCW
jgi:deoxyribodipyrimidine photo-lyase